MGDISKFEANSQIQVQAWSEEQIDLIKNQVAKGATTDELKMFLYIAKKTNLDPFVKEIWFYKMRPTDPPVIMTSRDGYLKIAHSHPQFDGLESYTIDDDKGNPIKAVCVVYRKDMSRPFKAEAKLKEYRKNNTIWSQYPSAMIIKVAEVMALKRAFSINGVITEEEIALEPTSKITPEVKVISPVKELDAEEYNLMLNSENAKEISQYLTQNYKVLNTTQRQTLQAKIKDLKNKLPAEEIDISKACFGGEEIDLDSEPWNK